VNINETWMSSVKALCQGGTHLSPTHW